MVVVVVVVGGGRGTREATKETTERKRIQRG